MEVISWGKTRKEIERERKIDLLLSFCRERQKGGGCSGCPIARICYSHPLGEGITSFPESELQDALALMASKEAEK